ncbi:MAG TPA: type II secretion system F family protein [Planctomycetota bacterium]|jgi:type IV pilus assembly protein PilC
MATAIALERPQSVPMRRSFSMSLKVSQKQLTEFTRELATLLEAGLPLVRSLDILHAQLKNGMLKNVVGLVKEDVESGCAFSESLARHPAAFDKLYVNMIRAGEAGGVLDEILSRLADYREKSQRLQQRIIGALIYPTAVITIAGGILAGIMIFIIPRFEAMFKEMGMGDLPPLTQALMMTANAFVDYWYALVMLPPLVWMGTRFLGQTPAGRMLIDRVKLKVPVFGLIISKSCVSRFCRMLGTLVQSGVPILEALSIIKNATGNAVVAGAVESVHSSIKEGDTIAEPLRHSGVFDPLVVNMVNVGEETGELDRMLMKVADTYDYQVDTLVGAMMSLLEPFLIVSMGVIVGAIVLGLFWPILRIMESIR